MSNSVIPTVIEQMLEMPEDQQQQILDYVRALHTGSRRGVPGKQLLEFAGIIPPTDLEQIAQTIKEGCERIDQDEW
jgi:hypothetical protein